MRIVFILAVIASALSLSVLPGSAYAEKKTGGKGGAYNPFHEDIKDLSLDLAKSFDKDQTIALVRIRDAYGMMRAVKIVETDVGKAVKECAEKHDSVKGDITAGFTDWQGAVHPLLTKNEKIMENVIDSAFFDDTERTKIRAYLQLIDKSAAYADGKLNKQTISTLDSCKALVKSFDKTEKAVVNIMDDIKWPKLPEEKKDTKE